ncbi:hypothetical protein PQO03_03380 [Lentisphaera profundi]|uniref:Uncharacterized protein n=1 Tax=Lentisphaera profundi TaxID=1658616 RepID=A0ABY7VVT2_9BACT|nr:hypothetical protein [Lentisphaera profundi]WDE97002.1 hypothetical protein PQO03_03380 [Lentisphaera profundi]
MNELKKININDLNWGLLIVLLIMITIIIYSAALSSTIAEKRGHTYVIHFFLGLILPIVYPIFIFGSMKNKLKASATVSSIASEEEEDDDIPELDIAIDINEDFFKQYPTDKSGHRAGPFIFETDQGIITAQFIIEIQKQLLVIQTINPKGQEQTLRLPYEKIISCNT